jgi:VWFA-related protein
MAAIPMLNRRPAAGTTLVWALVCLAAATLAAQQVFRGRVDLVRVDVSVIDNRTGKPVTDLKAADFTVEENGTPQRIDAFAFNQMDGPGVAGPAPASTASPASPLPGPSRRVFLIIFGRPSGSMSFNGPFKQFDGTIRFLRERLRPGDLVSIMAFNRFTELSADHESAVRLVERLKTAHPEEYYQARIAAPTRGVRADLSALRQAAIDRVMAPAEEGLRLRSATDLILNSPAFIHTKVWRGWNGMVMGLDSLKLHAAIEYLRRVEGSKQVVLFTFGLTIPARIIGAPPGLFHQDKDDDVRLARRAADAGVALNTINVTGINYTYSQAGNSFGVAGMTDIQSLQAVSEFSGGHYTGVRTADDQFERLDLATRSTYAIGYSSTNPQFDGKYRNVRVTVNRRDVTVVFRHGYTATPDIPPADLREILTAQRFRDASATDLEPRDLSVKAEAVEGDPAGKTVNVSLLIDGSRLTLEKQGARWVGEIDLVVLTGTREQKVTGTVKQRMTLGMDDARYKQATTTGIPYTVTVPVSERSASVKVMVYEFASDKMGTAVASIKQGR